MRRNSLLAFIVLGTSLLVGCQGSDNGSDGGPQDPATPPPTPVRGTLLQNPPALAATFSASDLTTEMAEVIGPLKCQQVDVYRLQYNTVGGANEATTGSGALMVPRGTDSACQGRRPILLYAHGTAFNRNFDIAALDGQGESLLLAALFAANGYIVVAPNYAGYSTSTLDYHPYLNAEQQSKDMIDALAAARSALPVAAAPGVLDNGKLFITGNSQGGYVAMATHRALQSAGVPVAASAPISGLYTLSAFGDAIFQGQAGSSQTLLLLFAISSYQRSYGIYMNPTELFEPEFATNIETLVPASAGTFFDLVRQRRVPLALFSSTPPDPEFAPLTPTNPPAPPGAISTSGFDEPHLITNPFRLSYLRDAQTNPDGGFPTNVGNLPPANPTNSLRAAFKTNDLRTWAPMAPTLLCAGSSDPVVFYLNTQLIQGYFDMVSPGTPVTMLDIDAPVEEVNDPFAAPKQVFAAAKADVADAAVSQGAGDGGARAVFTQYHGLVAPACLLAAREFFADK